jgi:AcrR family transcriptional regulator
MDSETDLSYSLTMSPAERSILEATQRCCERWGLIKVNVDDVAAEAGISRATLYRHFPGGRDVLFEALRVMELEDFFLRLSGHIDGADSLRDLLVRTVVHATRELRTDDHLAIMLASAPGEMIGQLTVDGLPRIIRVATLFIAPLLDPYLGRAEALRLVDVMARLVISYFLAPSDLVDLSDAEHAAEFIDAFILPTFTTTL